MPSKGLALILSLVVISMSCRPLCRIGPSNDARSKAIWFGQRVELTNEYAWERKQPYANTTIYIEPVDLSELKNCSNCAELTARLETFYKSEWAHGFSRQAKLLRVVNNKEEAELVAFIKIAGVKELRTFWKLPLGFIQNSDKFTIWFKIVNRKTENLVFIAQMSDFISNSRDVSLEGAYFAKLTDNFETNKSR